jgi:hypothetical protein
MYNAAGSKVTTYTDVPHSLLSTVSTLINTFNLYDKACSFPYHSQNQRQTFM